MRKTPETCSVILTIRGPCIVSIFVLIYFQRDAILCSMRWLDIMLTVVPAVVDFRYISISGLVGFRIIKRSRQFMQLFFSVCWIKMVWVYLVYVLVDGIGVYAFCVIY